jgi:hypothetical protein
LEVKVMEVGAGLERAVAVRVRAEEVTGAVD